MGNLLLTVLLNLTNAGYQTEGFGVEIDDTLLAVAASTSDLTQANVQYFHQDGLQDLLVDPVDVAISDLPIGYYPNDQKAKRIFNKRQGRPQLCTSSVIRTSDEICQTRWIWSIFDAK